MVERGLVAIGLVVRAEDHPKVYSSFRVSGEISALVDGGSTEVRARVMSGRIPSIPASGSARRPRSEV
jgi:hypothetical protein